MIKVASRTYFNDVQEVHNLNQHLRKNPESKDIFSDYIKEKFNATYKKSENWPAQGIIFVFENERDAIVFMLKWP